MAPGRGAAAVQHHGERRGRCPVPGARWRREEAPLVARDATAAAGSLGGSDQGLPALGMPGAGQRAPLLPGSRRCWRVGISAGAAVPSSADIPYILYVLSL